VLDAQRRNEVQIFPPEAVVLRQLVLVEDAARSSRDLRYEGVFDADRPEEVRLERPGTTVRRSALVQLS
jgi:hypothetical protein